MSASWLMLAALAMLCAVQIPDALAMSAIHDRAELLACNDALTCSLECEGALPAHVWSNDL